MTQMQLCKGVVTPSMISQIEADKTTPSMELLEQLASRLGVDAGYFALDVTLKSDLSQTYRRAKALMEAGDYAEAVPLLQSLAEPLAPQFREEVLYADLALCYDRVRDLDKAAKMYLEVVRSSHERDDVRGAVHAYYNLGQVKRRQNEPALARMYWQSASELLRRHSNITMPIALRIHLNLGRVHHQLKEYQAALESYRRAVVLSDKHTATLDLAMAHHGCGVTNIELGNHDEAETSLLEAIRLYDVVRHQRGVNQCHVNMGINLRKAGKYEAAREHLTWCTQYREIQLDTLRLANTYSERSLCFLALGHFSEAMDDAKEAIALDKDTPDVQATARRTLAVAYLHEQRLSDALRVIEDATPYALRSDNRAQVVQLRNARIQILQELGETDALLAESKAIAEFVQQQVVFPGQ